MSEPQQQNTSEKVAAKILLGANAEGQEIELRPEMANRHGLIAGATGTGKTVSLQILAEGFSRLGVPVFTADVKGDLSGLCEQGKPHEKIDERKAKIGLEKYSARGYPLIFWDVFGEKGLPLRTTISEMGPMLLSHLLGLNDTQDGVLHVAFSLADDEGMLLLDLKDLRSLLAWMGENAAEIKTEYGSVSPNSVAAIQRRLHVLQEAGGDQFFGEPALKIEHLLQKDFSGNGVINVLEASTLMSNPQLYSTVLLWLLSELFEDFEEVGDQEVPKLVFFFDEAHLLFDNAPKALLEKIEQVVRLIRSKGVGVYFVTQHPLDVPDSVLGQLGNRIQHALRAFTPRDKKAVKTAAETFRANPKLDTKRIITQLGVGEALVSVLDEDGQPTVVEQTLIVPPESLIGPCSDEKRLELNERSPLRALYQESVDRESAYEILKKRQEELEEREKRSGNSPAKSSGGRKRQSATEAFFKSMMRSIGNTIGRRIVRGILGSIIGGRR